MTTLSPRQSTGSYKTEVIYGHDQGRRKTIENVELETLSLVHWWNTERLHGYLDDNPTR